MEFKLRSYNIVVMVGLSKGKVNEHLPETVDDNFTMISMIPYHHSFRK